MTAENRERIFSAFFESKERYPFSHLVKLARAHGEEILANNVSPQVASVAVEEFILKNNPEAVIFRRNAPPFDVSITSNGEQKIVFIHYQSFGVTESHGLSHTILHAMVERFSPQVVEVVGAILDIEPEQYKIGLKELKKIALDLERNNISLEHITKLLSSLVQRYVPGAVTEIDGNHDIWLVNGNKKEIIYTNWLYYNLEAGNQPRANENNQSRWFDPNIFE